MDSQFVDVDFRTDPHYVRGDWSLHVFGHGSQRYASYGDLVPENKWQELAEKLQAAGGGCSGLVTRIYDQQREGSCVANACSQANEIIQAKQFGRDNVVHLSAISLYKRIGRSPSSGATINDGLAESQKGILPLDNPENRERFGAHVMPNTGFSTPYPEGWESTAKMFAAVEWTVVDSVEELVSALFNQHPVVVGRQGHSICYCDPTYREGKLHVKYANSWGSWGDEGYGYDTLSQIRQSSDWAFALRSVTTPKFREAV